MSIFQCIMWHYAITSSPCWSSFYCIIWKRKWTESILFLKNEMCILHFESKCFLHKYRQGGSLLRKVWCLLLWFWLSLLSYLLHSKSSSDVLFGKKASFGILQKCNMFLVTTRSPFSALVFIKVPFVCITI